MIRFDYLFWVLLKTLKKEEEVTQEQISKKTTITYFDKYTLEVDDSGILLSVVGERLEDLLNALT